MKDRVPRYPGRVTLTPVSGQANTYDMARADDPTEAGTPLNTATLLATATAQAIFGDSNDHTVNEALSALLGNANSRAKMQVGSYVGTGKYGTGNETSVTFSFAPKLVIIGGEVNTNFGVLLPDNPRGWSFSDSWNDGKIQSLGVTVSGNTVAWAGPTDDAQLNTKHTYHYVAFG